MCRDGEMATHMHMYGDLRASRADRARVRTVKRYREEIPCHGGSRGIPGLWYRPGNAARPNRHEKGVTSPAWQ